MGLLILVLMMFGLYTVWKASREYIRTGKQTTWTKVALWGVKNLSPTGFIVISVLLFVFKVWPVLFAVAVVWFTYYNIRKDLLDAELLHP